MSWHESKCLVCGEDTSGALPYLLGNSIAIYPCKKHDKTVCDEAWQKDYLSRCSTVKYCFNCKKWLIVENDDCSACGKRLKHKMLEPSIDAKKFCEGWNKLCKTKTFCHICGKDSTGFKPFLMSVSKHIDTVIYPCVDHIESCRIKYQPWSESNA